MESLADISPIRLALLATLFTWGVTMLGAASVFLMRSLNQKLLDWLLGFAGGVMVAASFWSLLAPAIELSAAQGVPPWLPPVIGFLLGGGFLHLLDKTLPHLHIGARTDEAEGPPSSLHRSVLLVIAITLHNIPEGLAVGVAIGAASLTGDPAAYGPALALALGIGLQNFPEGIAVAMPLRREGMSRRRAFFYGQASALVEPAAGVLGAAAVLAAQPILPYALAFAAGAMIFVVVEEVIPEAQRFGNADLTTFGVMLGFAVMMVLDVALG
ncbi:MAG: ZIP family metal transporter [Chloroflexota bacterium]|nr:MAG: ZIP family metal transporter [Chloroflexota bacterium]